MKRKQFVIFSTADWDNPFWTNKQHVASELARLGAKVLYVDSVGLRKPSASGSDLKRIVRRIGSVFRGVRKVEDNIWVLSPVLLPFHGSVLAATFNRVLLTIMIRACSWWVGLSKPILWTYNPITTQLLSLRSFSGVVYHCVDEVKAQPGMPALIIEAREKELISASTVVFVTAEPLLASRKLVNENTFYYPNVADYEHFRKAQLDVTPVASDLNNLKGRVIGFIGAISSYKIDFDLLIQIALKRPDWNIVLIGKVGEGDPWTQVGDMQGIDNIKLIGPRPYSELPSYLKKFDVAIMPNRLNEYTLGMFPMKFFEYLAAGRPVVSVPLKSIAAHGDLCRFAATADEFIEQIEYCIANTEAIRKHGDAEAQKNTYAARTQAMLQDLDRCSSTR